MCYDEATVFIKLLFMSVFTGIMILDLLLSDFHFVENILYIIFKLSLTVLSVTVKSNQFSFSRKQWNKAHNARSLEFTSENQLSV